jgi:predicted metalloprotease with PDZ domain
VAGDEPAGAVLRPAVLQQLGCLVREAQAEYGTHHYQSYHFLITRSAYAGGDGGVEHAQSTDIGMGRSTFLDDATQMAEGGLLAHEFTHSWNGKYRRPTGECTPDFATPLKGEMLWVYEGMTQYLENVLATRAGLKSLASYREMLALDAAEMAAEPGRQWRSTEDTAIAVSVLRGHAGAWLNWRRGKDYYPEGELLWLDVDTLIRELTREARSLDDFERVFLGRGGNTGPAVLPYDFAEIVADLNQVVPYDWSTFLQHHVADVNPQADLDGIERGGYRLAYAEQPSHAERVFSDVDHELYAGDDFWHSLGLRIDPRGSLIDVRWDSPADWAKLTPKQQVLTVNAAEYSASVLRAAVAAAKTQRAPLRLTVRQDGESVPVEIDYHGGERFPVLERIAGTADRLQAIVAARTR